MDKDIKRRRKYFCTSNLPVLKFQAEFIIKYFGGSFYIRYQFFIRFVSRYVHFQNLLWQKQHFVEGNEIEKARKYSFTERSSFLRKAVDGKLHYKIFRLNCIKILLMKYYFESY